MNCAEYRRALLADPAGRSDEISRHARSCLECAHFTRKAQAFESRLQRALHIPVDAPAGAGALRRAQPRWLGLAASLMAGVGLAVTLWLSSPRSGLAHAVIEHMAEEPAAWDATSERVDAARLEEILHASKLRLKAPLSQVSYAQSCAFRGHQVPHLVLQSGRGAVTVMVLSHETISREQNFDEAGYHGLLVPIAGHGSLAVLQRGDDSPDEMREAAARVARAVQWDE